MIQNKYIKLIMKYIFVVNLVGEEEGVAISVAVVEDGGGGGSAPPEHCVRLCAKV
jgi:hypothetical protein